MEWLENAVKRMHWYDISLVKLSVFFATLFLMTAWAGFRDFIMGFDWNWYFALMIVCMVVPLKRLFLD